MKIKLASILALLFLVLAGCLPQKAQPAALVLPGGGSPQTWIDAPLEGMHLPLAASEIVFHATDEHGIAQAELIVDNEVLAVLPASTPGSKLVTFKQVWNPPAPGEYVIRTRGQDSGGSWGGYSAVKVYVGEPTATVTATASVTPTIDVPVTPTLTATPTPTATATLTPTPGELTFTPQVSTNQFYYGGCSQTSIDIRVQVSGGEAYSVVLFVRLADQGGSGTTSWNSYNAMAPTGNGGFRITANSTSLPGYNTYPVSWLEYQFVATDQTGAVIGRSPAYADVALSTCGSGPIVPSVTPGPIILTPIIPILPTITLPTPTPTWPVIK